MRWIQLIGLLLVPSMAFAVTDCRVVEHPDHDELICEGDAKPGESKDPSDAVRAVRGKARPQTKFMDAARESRSRLIEDQRNKDSASPDIAEKEMPK